MLSSFESKGPNASSGSSARSTASTTSSSRLRPLNKLAAAEVIAPFETRSTTVPKKAASKPLAPRLSSRPKATVAQRAPFVVPLNFNGPRRGRVTVQPKPKVILNDAIVKAKVSSPSRIPRRRIGSPATRSSGGEQEVPSEYAVKDSYRSSSHLQRTDELAYHSYRRSSLSTKCTYSSCEAFAHPSFCYVSYPDSHAPASPDVFTADRTTPRPVCMPSTPSRIPRFRFSTSPTAPSPSSPLSMASASSFTPYTSPVLVVMEDRLVASMSFAGEGVSMDTSMMPEIGEEDSRIPSLPTELSITAEFNSFLVGRLDSTDPPSTLPQPLPLATKTTLPPSPPQEASPNFSFISELKARLSWTGRKPSPSDFIPRRSSATENFDPTSELQQALARRRHVMSQTYTKATDAQLPSSPKQPTRQPLAPLPSFVNGVFVGRHDSSPAIGVETTEHIDCSSPANLAVTEINTTPFGARRVRRMVIPPLQEGSRPSRDPRIVMELDFLRARQKVAKRNPETKLLG
ncbi:hypothetical protein R3P38DRAFT_2846242 [Favolaschia claudopus]|uniref:Uncharacterized protein n=1 Tax=Favolaschia claudopus TaxID=2862362 RepID=A0AAW0DTQ0_9AGAR